MINFHVSEEIYRVCPAFKGAAVFSSIKNSLFNSGLWEIIEREILLFKSEYTLDDIKKNPVIESTRSAYKKLGKDPNRYRPSAEALCRRILRDLPLYKINTAVDIINLVSFNTGYSIGGFDADKIKGTTLTLGVGQPGEPYESIGRGMMNIEGLPVYRDREGGIGTPTSDNERTKLDVDSSHLLIVFNGYNGTEGLSGAVSYTQSLLNSYVSSGEDEIIYF